MYSYLKQTILFTLIINFAFCSLAGAQSIHKTVHSKSVNKKNAYNFIHYFPDTSLAILVAERLHKKVEDIVSIKELARIKGNFEVGPGSVSNLKGIGYLTGINSFGCYKNEVTEIPAEIGKLTNLVSLDLCKAFSLEKVPPEIGNLNKLKWIRLCLTQVKVIPKEIGNLNQLEYLDISCNRLRNIPAEIGNLKSLKRLYIESNILKKVPDEICNLTSLTSLDMSYCMLIQLPDSIGNLRSLRFLNLFKNDLRVLPPSIKMMDILSTLNVFDNFNLSESYKMYLPKLLKKKKR